MAPAWKQQTRASATGVTVTTTTETVAATLPGIFTQSGGGFVDLEALVDLSTGTTVTGVTVRIRQGTGITGTIVGTPVIPTLGASSRFTIPVNETDSVGEVNGLQYVVTVQQAGAGTNGTVNYASILAQF